MSLQQAIARVERRYVDTLSELSMEQIRVQAEYNALVQPRVDSCRCSCSALESWECASGGINNPLSPGVCSFFLPRDFRPISVSDNPQPLLVLRAAAASCD